ncbi:MAG TPA: SDR family oxidoreductase [Acetobacteraceae bacterium]|nr:SDR family oxidoreductase [Acetobacteraceae bacterium]
MSRFAGRAVLITGGGQGIGRTTALRFAREGAAVAVLDRSADAAAAVVAAIRDAGGRGAAVVADLADAAACAPAVAAAEAALGPLDVLVNNAARAERPDVASTDLAAWEGEFAVTVRAAFLMTKAVLVGMAARGGGVIVSVASVNGHVALGNPAYSAAKAALLNFTRSVAVEYGPHGVRAVTVSPGTVRTESPSWRDRLSRNPRVFEDLARWYPLGRVGEPEDIAAAIAFLASDDAAFITGTDLAVDGGLLAGYRPMVGDIQS